MGSIQVLLRHLGAEVWIHYPHLSFGNSQVWSMLVVVRKHHNRIQHDRVHCLVKPRSRGYARNLFTV